MSHVKVREERLGSPPESLSKKFSPIEAIWFENLSLSFPRIRNFTVSLDVTSVPANSTAEQTFTVSGVASNDMVLSVNKPTHTSDLIIGGYRVSAKDTIAITFKNSSGSPIDPAAEEYEIAVLRKE